ncbi:MAG: FHA domain-containing protein [Candidatus Humimicrobiaceae bacterium]
MDKEKKEKTESIKELQVEIGGEVSSNILESIKDLPKGSRGFLIIKGPSIGEKFILGKPPITVGRDANSDIFLDDVTVSREHASIEEEDGNLKLVDEGSLNGSYVNGKRVESSPLNNGDKIQIGKYIFLYFKA